MTRSLSFIAALLLVLNSGLSYSQEKKAAAPEWKEKNEFHMVMAQTFHPAEEGNFDPLLKRSGELAVKASAWANSTYPKAYDKKELHEELALLVEKAKALNEMVQQNAATEQLKVEISELHDLFHKIVGMCSPEDKSNENHKTEMHPEHSK